MTRLLVFYFKLNINLRVHADVAKNARQLTETAMPFFAICGNYHASAAALKLMTNEISAEKSGGSKQKQCSKRREDALWNCKQIVRSFLLTNSNAENYYNNNNANWKEETLDAMLQTDKHNWFVANVKSGRQPQQQLVNSPTTTTNTTQLW